MTGEEVARNSAAAQVACGIGWAVLIWAATAGIVGLIGGLPAVALSGLPQIAPSAVAALVVWRKGRRREGAALAIASSVVFLGTGTCFIALVVSSIETGP